MPEDENGVDVIADAMETGGGPPTPPTGGDRVPGPDAPDGEAPPEAPPTAEHAPEPESGPLERLFVEPANVSPLDLDGHEIVRLVKDGLGEITSSPKNALLYVLKSVIAAVDKFVDVDLASRRLPAGIHVVIGIFAVPLSLFGGDEDDDGAGDQDEPADGGDDAGELLDPTDAPGGTAAG